MADESLKLILEYIEKNTAAMNKVVSRIGDVNREIVKNTEITKKNSMTWTEFRSALGVVQQGLQYAQQAYQAVIAPTIEYANQVRILSQVSGESAEETSRFIQVLDDFKIGADDALTATRALTKQGLAPNIETLAQLSDQYLAISDAQERNEFVMKNLGRAGLQWTEVLGKGSDAIREMGDAVDDGLILNQKAIDQARQYELAVDSLSESWEGLRNEIGPKAIPVLTDVVKIMVADTQAITGFGDVLKQSAEEADNFAHFADKVAVYLSNIQDFAADIVSSNLPSFMGDSADAAGDLADEGNRAAQSMEDQTLAAQSEEEAIKALSSAYQGMLGNMFSLKDARESYQKSLEDLKQEEQEITDTITRETLEYQALVTVGKAGIEVYSAHAAAMDELTGKLEENAEAQRNLAETTADATKKMIFDLVQQRMAADEVTSEEFTFLQNLAVQQGLVTRADADRAIAVSQAADSIISDYQEQNAVLLDTQAQINALVGGSPYIAQVVIETIGTIPNLSNLLTKTRPLTTGAFRGPTRRRQEGGYVTADMPYLVGERGPEIFMPSRSGQIISNDNIATTININIASIRSLSDIDYLAQEVKRRIGR